MKSQKRKINKSLILYILKNIENKTPKNRLFLNLFNTGIIIDSETIKKLIIQFLKDKLK